MVLFCVVQPRGFTQPELTDGPVIWPPTFAALQVSGGVRFATQRLRGLSCVTDIMPAPLHAMCWNVGLQDNQLQSQKWLEGPSSLTKTLFSMRTLMVASEADILMFQDSPHLPSAFRATARKAEHYPLARPRCPAGRLRPASPPTRSAPA